jgi:Radical SAM superfamily
VKSYKNFRNLALSMIDPAIQLLPSNPSTVYIWPTELCSISCRHCNFASKPDGNLEKQLIAKHPEAVVKWATEAGVSKLIACGGGEPLDQPECIERIIAACAQEGLRFGIYTSGISRQHPKSAVEHISTWKQLWAARICPEHQISVRLSVDSFHEERISLDPVLDWITAIENFAPEFNISIRGLRLKNDSSIKRLADRLNADLRQIHQGSASMKLPSGRRIAVELKGFVFDGRGKMRSLKHLGLEFHDNDTAVLNSHMAKYSTNNLGRPLSARLPVTRGRIDLEVRSDGVVYIMESQAIDLRLSLFTNTWEEIKNHYYRDPIMHCVVKGGLPVVAELILAADQLGISSKKPVLFSVNKLTDQVILDWITAKAILLNCEEFIYGDDLKRHARSYLDGFRQKIKR